MASPRIAAQTARYTYYEVAEGVFNTSPTAKGGYAVLASLRALKGDR